MNLLPYQNVVFRSELNVADVSKKIREHIKPVTAVSSPRNTKEYEGEIVGNTFNIRRIIWHRNSFLPVIKGTITKEPSGTKIQVKFGLNTIVLISVYVFWGLSLTLSIVTVISSLIFAHFALFTLGPLAFLLFMYLLVTISFNFESSKSKKDLKSILEAEIESE
jgi:hypothetical protein